MSSDQIYSAKYSGVEVYEFIHPTGSIMKRKADNWVNATHILKAAKFPKAKRTRILEKEVITDTHEKVQGGFGKYQGTWIPLELARKLAEKFEVLEELRPLFDFTQQEGTASPPHAPKHHHASRTDSVRKRATKSASTTTSKVPEAKSSSQSSSQRQQQKQQQKAASASGSVSVPRRGRPPRNKPTVALQRSQSEMVFPKPSIPFSSIQGTKLPSLQPQLARSSTSLSPIVDVKSPLDQTSPQFKELDIEDGLSSDIEPNSLMAAKHEDSTHIMNSKDEPVSSSSSLPSSPTEFSQSVPFSSRPNIQTPLQMNGTTSMNMILPKFPSSQNSQSDSNQRANDYLTKLVNYFISNDLQNESQTPVDLLNPPLHCSPFIDTWIDPEHHTAFHWACAMGNLAIVEALLKAGASIRSVNNVGETPLIRSSIFHNCYTKRTYPQIFEILKDTVFDLDAKSRNVIHRIVARKSHTPSAVYYLDVVLSKIKDFTPQYRIDVLINQQDSEGNSPLHYAAMNKDNQFYQLLVKNGALTTIHNLNGMSPNGIINGKYSTEDISKGQRLDDPYDFNRMYPSQAATTANRSIPDVINMMKEMSNSYQNLYQKRQNDAIQMERTVKSMNKTISSIENKLMDTLHVKQLGDIDVVINQRRESIEELQRRISANKRTLMNTLESGQVKLIRKFVDEESKEVKKEEETENDENSESVHELLKDLVLLQLKRKRKITQIIDVITDNSKVYKYRKMISQGTDIDVPDVDECLDVIYDTLSKES
ncbi:Transcription factor mbp1 [Kluyveromyces marxianus]|nr:Transcription factor mbp1 [Kluyveromyces marxianus]